MDEISALLITRALDGLALRSSAIAQNIANAGSRNYAPVRVSFEDELRQAARSGSDALRNFTPHMTRVPLSGSGGVRLDLEMAGASQTALRYAALVDVLSRNLALSRIAMNGGQQ